MTLRRMSTEEDLTSSGLALATPHRHERGHAYHNILVPRDSLGNLVFLFILMETNFLPF